MILRGTSQYLERKRTLRSQMTSAERLLWMKLKGRQFYGLKFRRQHGIHFHIVDFYCAQKRLVIELDGDVHACLEQKLKDAQRTQTLQTLGLKVLRYSNEEVLHHWEAVLEDLRRKVLESKE